MLALPGRCSPISATSRPITYQLHRADKQSTQHRPLDCKGKLDVMAKQVRPWLSKPATNRELTVRPPDEGSTSGFHQGQRNSRSSFEGRIYGCNRHLLNHNERACLANRGASIYGS